MTCMIDRRAILAGLAGTAVGPSLPEASAAVTATGNLVALLATHRARAIKAKEVTDRWTALSDATKMPDCRVVQALNFSTKEPWYVSTFEEIDDWARQCDMGWNHAAQEKQRTAKKAELQALWDERSRIRAEAGLDEMERLLGAECDAEWSAFEAIRDFRPQTLEEAQSKAAYLIEMANADENRKDDIESYAFEILVSLAPIGALNDSVHSAAVS